MPTADPDTARPFLKWAGGKTQMLGRFASLYPPPGAVRRYVEPFVGSGAVYFHVRRLLSPQQAVLADSNEDLVNAWIAVRDEVEAVIRALEGHRDAHSREHYYRVRARPTRGLSRAARAARLIYLNKTCFNGLYRVNRRGEFNVPMGRYANPPILDTGNLRAASAALHGVRIELSGFADTLRYAKRGDFLYFDPPYDPVSTTASFTSYTRGRFDRRAQEDLARVFAALHRRGCLVMLSNSDTSFVRGLYGDPAFDIREVPARRSINARADRRGTIGEIVVLNYAPP